MKNQPNQSNFLYLPQEHVYFLTKKRIKSRMARKRSRKLAPENIKPTVPVNIESTETIYPESSASSGSFSAPSSAISVVNDPNYRTETEETEESSDRHRVSDTESESLILHR